MHNITDIAKQIVAGKFNLVTVPFCTVCQMERADALLHRSEDGAKMGAVCSTCRAYIDAQVKEQREAIVAVCQAKKTA